MRNLQNSSTRFSGIALEAKAEDSQDGYRFLPDSSVDVLAEIELRRENVDREIETLLSSLDKPPK